MFEVFSRELSKYDNGVHRLYPPATKQAIVEAEQDLGIQFPEQYRRFLGKWNGGLLFAREFFDTILWSVSDVALKELAEYNMELVRNNRTLVEEQGHPRQLLAFASYSDGNLLCFDMRTNGNVVHWNKAIGREEERWDSLEAWLAREMHEGADLYDYHGNERESQ